MEIRRQINDIEGYKTKYYNYNKFGHIAKDCKQPMKEKKPQGCFTCGKEEHIAIECRIPQ